MAKEIHPIFKNIMQPWLSSFRKDVFGWFEMNREEPAFDPGMDGICPLCGNKLERPVKTISFMPLKTSRSYFYRVHKRCYDNSTEDDRVQIEGIIIDDSSLNP